MMPLLKVSIFTFMKIMIFLARSTTWSIPSIRCPLLVSHFLRISKPWFYSTLFHIPINLSSLPSSKPSPMSISPWNIWFHLLSQNPNFTILLLIEELWLIVLIKNHLLMKSIGLQPYNMLRIPQLHVNTAEKVTLRTDVGQNMAILVNTPIILKEDIAVPQDHPNLIALLDNTVPRITKDNVLSEVEEVLMGVNLSKEKQC